MAMFCCVVNISNWKVDKMALIVFLSDIEKGGNSFDSPRMDESATVESKWSVLKLYFNQYMYSGMLIAWTFKGRKNCLQ